LEEAVDLPCDITDDDDDDDDDDVKCSDKV
jgi:hypothetical protein